VSFVRPIYLPHLLVVATALLPLLVLAVAAMPAMLLLPFLRGGTSKVVALIDSLAAWAAAVSRAVAVSPGPPDA
jgi:flagellar biosynthesis/type III secretory pathway ATPase